MTATAFGQDHGHLNVGSSGTKLSWDNGVDFAPASGYVKTLTFTNGGKYAHFYQGNITLTALHSTNAFGERDPVAPLPGAFVVAEIVSVQGPVGGAFGFWENTSTTAPTISLPSGTTNAGFRFEVSESLLGAGEPGGDPFGHIHGRRLTATLPGVYTVGFRAHDLSTNGINLGPLHTQSDVQFVDFQAGVVLRTVKPTSSGVHVTLGAMAGFSWQLQSAESVPNPQWTDVGGAVVGNDLFVEIEDTRPATGSRFYRALGTGIAP